LCVLFCAIITCIALCFPITKSQVRIFDVLHCGRSGADADHEPCRRIDDVTGQNIRRAAAGEKALRLALLATPLDSGVQTGSSPDGMPRYLLGRPRESYTCFACGVKGKHFVEACLLSICALCRRKGHIAEYCPNPLKSCPDVQSNVQSKKKYGARFRQKFTPEDAIGSPACSLEVSIRVSNAISLGCSLLLPVGTVNCVQTLKIPQEIWKEIWQKGICPKQRSTSVSWIRFPRWFVQVCWASTEQGTRCVHTFLRSVPHA
jgi:hypothetical protein